MSDDIDPLDYLISILEPDSNTCIEDVVKTIDSLLANGGGGPSFGLRKILWNSGIDHFKENLFTKALQIYTLCLKFCCSESQKSKLYQNIAVCCLSEGDAEIAEDWIVKIKDESPKKCLLLFQVQLIKGELGMASEIIEKIDDEELIQTAAILAFKSNAKEIAKTTLYKAINVTPSHEFKLVALRCLLRLSKSAEEDLDLYKLLDNVGDMSSSEIAYFTDSAWNSGLKAKPNFSLMIEILVQCLEISSKMMEPIAHQYLQIKRNCCVLIIAAYFQLASDQNDTSHYKNAFEYLSMFKSFGNSNLDHATMLIIMLYELECAIKLEMPNINSLLACIYGLDQISSSTVDRVLDLCMTGKDKLVQESALKGAIDYHLKVKEPQWLHISKLFIHLIKVSLDTKAVFTKWSEFSIHFPENEAAWMVCEAWNRGIKSENKELSDDLCHLALKSAQALPNHKHMYTTHMKEVLLL